MLRTGVSQLTSVLDHSEHLVAICFTSFSKGKIFTSSVLQSTKVLSSVLNLRAAVNGHNFFLRRQ